MCGYVPPEARQKKPWITSRALAQRCRNVMKRIDEVVTRMHWQLHRQRILHFGHPHSNTRAAQR